MISLPGSEGIGIGDAAGSRTSARQSFMDPEGLYFTKPRSLIRREGSGGAGDREICILQLCYRTLAVNLLHCRKSIESIPEAHPSIPVSHPS